MLGGFGTSPIELMATQAMLDGLIYCAGFTYAVTWITGTSTALGANATVESDLQINADADFVVQEMNFTSYSAAATPITAPDYLLTVTIAGSGRQIMNQAVDVTLYTGGWQATGNGCQNALMMPMPVILTANTTLACTLQNRSGTASNRAALMMRGFKVYYTGGNRQSIFHVL